MKRSLIWIGDYESILLSNYLEIAIAVVLGVAMVGGVGWYVRSGRRSRGAKLLDRLAAHDSVAVLMHPNPDPDAMACALGVEYLAEHVGTDATLQYPGEIRHQENRAFETVLDLDLQRITGAPELAADAVVLVDHDAPRGFTGSGGVNPVAVIDHHPGGGTGSAFTDVRPDYGACASILAEYFHELDADRRGPKDGDPGGADRLTLPSRLATGLMYGIQSDTKRLSKGCSAADFDACAYLYPAIDEDRLDRIANPLVDAEVIDVMRRAIKERECRAPFAISDVGTVSNLDAIPQAADELIRIEDSTAVVVIGEKEDTLYLSGRSRDDRIHIGKTLKAAVDDIPMANAGGHARMGGGQVSLAHMHGLGPSTGLTRDEFHGRLFDAMAGEERTTPALRT